ncbi:hypothetical protein [Stutzerimonas nitrititolerans]|uniref:hypothetical protein n=1 Tax=Stutzerimonas nitrititolerans TaxID=2482751 RepID=UPI00289A1860|nr:hypothetical protein [Stutzerimonas nitrititolerans]
MATVKHHKVVAALPAVLEPDAIYYVRAGQGHDVYVTNGSGMIVGYPANAALGLAGKVDKAEGQSLMTDAERAKLGGIEAGATANATDAQLRDRATHTGTQAIDTVSGLQAVLAEKIDTTERGVSGGVATLDEYARIPSSQLPSYVDDVLEFPTRDDFPATGEGGKIYIAVNQGTQANPTRQYRWTGSVYAEINPSPGTTDALAEGSTNLYFSEHRVRNTLLTGLSMAVSTAITAVDTVLSAFGKIQAQLGLKADLNSPTFTGNPTAPTPAAEDRDTSIATTAHVKAAMALFGVGGVSVSAEANLNLYTIGGGFITPGAGLTPLPSGWGQGRHVVLVAGGGTAYGLQMLMGGGVNLNRVAVRSWSGSVFTDWQELWHTGNFDPATKQDKSAVIGTATTRTLALTDAWNLLRPATTGAITLTVPTNAAVAFEIGTEITIRSVGNITLASASGVVLEPQSGGTLNMTARMTVTLKKVAANEWIVIGQTVAA